MRVGKYACKDYPRPAGRNGLKVAVSVVLLAAALCSGSFSLKADSGKGGTISIGMEANAVNSLIYIAENRNYFADNDIKIQIDDSYPSGAAAVEGLRQGKADIATAAEFVLVRYTFTGDEVRAFGSIDMFMHMKLVGRKDMGIRSIPDLAGKKIGVPLKTAADFELGRFLDLHGVDKSNITTVNVQPSQTLAALVGVSVDAVVAWQPNAMAIQDRLGDNAVTWSVQSGQPMYCLLVTTGRWAESHPDLMQRFLNSLLKAEAYLIQNGEKARTIVQNRLGYDDRHIKTIWPEHQFSLRLDQSLITAMEDQSRWMIKNNPTGKNQVPNFLDYIYEDALKGIKPEAVNIIR